MFKMYFMDEPNNWEDYLHLVEFTYNNGYQTSTKTSPFEILYERRCNALVSWDNPVDKVMIGPYMLKEMEQEVNKERQNLKPAQYRKKHYVDLKRKHK